MKNFMIFLLALVLAIGLTAIFFSDEKRDVFTQELTTRTNTDLQQYCREMKVDGPSMEPTLFQDEKVCVYEKKPEKGSLAVFKCKNCGIQNEVVKRVADISNDCYWLLGDNPDHSLDSRTFGALCPKDLEYIYEAKKIENPTKN